MGNSKWYFGPIEDVWWTDTGDIETIDLGRKSMVVSEDLLRTSKQLELGYGFIVSFDHGGGLGVRIRTSIGGDEVLAERHDALLTQLHEGRPVSFAQDSALAWAVPLESVPARGDTGLNYATTSPFALYEGIDDPTNHAVCIIQSALPQLRRELVELDAIDTGEMVVSTTRPLVQQYDKTDDIDRLPILRPEYFLPFLRLVPGQQGILKQKSGLGWVFDASFVVDVEREHDTIGHVT